MNIMFKDSLFSEQLNKIVGYSSYHGSEIGECFEAAALIQEGNFSQWCDEWTKLADHIKHLAEESKANNRKVSAYQAYLRASTYYRNSYFFLRANSKDERIKKNFAKNRECFTQAMLLSSYHCQFIDIPFENGSFPGYLFSPDNANPLRPLLICINGYQGTAQDSYITNVIAALERGYNCITFDGPGQGRLLIEHNTYMRPDWENIVKAIIDYVSNLPEIDLNSIALIGRDIGAYFALRAATKEQRIAAVINDPGIYNVSEYILAHLPSLARTAYVNQQKTLLEGFVHGFFRLHKKRAFYFKSRMAAHGADSIYQYLKDLEKYDLKQTLQDISCSTLICDNDSDNKLLGQPNQLFNALKSNKRYTLFTKAEGASGACEPLALTLFNQRIFDWLDTVFKRV